MHGVKSMAAKQTERVIITGAGFSAPAQLPIQNKIIDKMVEDPGYDFLSGKMPLESIKFLNAYINVGLFLLDNYGKDDYKHLENEYNRLQTTTKIRNDIQSYGVATFSKDNSVIKTIDEFILLLPSTDDEYSQIYTLKNKVRIAIEKENISINLEDIFTSFDKSFLSSEYVHSYTYSQMDVIRYSIMRLFSYYFSKGVIDHLFDQIDYENFIRFLQTRRSKKPTTIITTNWDTLLEGYLERKKIGYNYGFQAPYTSEDSSNIYETNEILLLKIHGSANWLKCLHCGAISVYKENDAASSLFKDGEYEQCAVCEARSNVGKPSLQPEIITPTMIKSLSNRLYSNLWGTASSEIRSATHITFLGYSLPIADFDFRYMLQRNVPQTAIIDVVLYKNSNPEQVENESLKNLLPEKRYRDAFPKNKINFYYEGFGNFFAKKQNYST